MTRHYIRLDPAFDEHKEPYPDGPYAALVGTFCLAESQPQRGRFRSADYLRRLLGKRGRFVPFLVQHGDLTELEDGRLYVDGWDEWQEGDWKVAERVSRIRSRSHRYKGNARVTPDVTVGVTPDVTPLRQNGAVRSGAELGAAADRSSAGKASGLSTDQLLMMRAKAVLADKMASDEQKQMATDALRDLGVTA